MEAYITGEQLGICRRCKDWKDLRLGFCFECADAGEKRAAKWTVLQHIAKGIGQFWRGYRTEARISFCWAWERMTSTGDYKPGGEFENYR